MPQGILYDLYVRVVKAATIAFPASETELSHSAARILRLFQSEFFGGMIRLLRAGHLGISNLDSPSHQQHPARTDPPK